MRQVVRLRFVRGHRIDRTFYPFPHRCPGSACAIWEFYRGKHAGENYARISKRNREFYHRTKSI